MIDDPLKPVQFNQEQEAKEAIAQTPYKKKNHHLFQRLSSVLGGLGILTILVLAFRPPPIVVEVAEVKRSDVQVTVDEEGETRIRKRYLVSANSARSLSWREMTPSLCNS